MALEEKRERKLKVGGLVGRFGHTLDPKKRLTIPSEWRDAMGLDVTDKDTPFYVYVIPNETEDCLDLVPFEEMQSVHDRLAEKDILENDAEAAALWQFAEMLKVDSAGRIRIGDELLATMGITGGVTLIGAYRKAQIWAADKKPLGQKLDLAAYRAALARRKKA